MKDSRSPSRMYARLALFVAGALALFLALGAIELPAAPSAEPTSIRGRNAVEFQARRQTAAQRRAAARRAAQRRTAQRRRRTPPPPPPPAAATPRGAAALRQALGTIMTSRTRSGTWSASVVSLTRGDTLYQANAGVPVLPASTMKLLTSAIALERLGPNYRFSTDILRDGDVDANGALNGNIYIRGDGDPAFSRRFHSGTYSEPVDKLARAVAAAGIKRVTGAVIGDATAFDNISYPEGWLDRYRGSSYAARVSALSLAENLLWVTVAPGRSGTPARVTIEPGTTTIAIRGLVRSVAGGGAAVRASYMADGNIFVSGRIGTRSPVRRFGLVVNNPPAFTTGAFHAALRAAGVAVDGGAKLGKTPGSATKVTSLLSPPLEQLVAIMNRESINLFAELLLRNAVRGPSREGQGSARAAESMLRGFFSDKMKTDPSQLTVADGSGLSTLDRVTGNQMAELLGYAHSAPWGPAFHASLPVAGQSELLRRRMRQGQADGNLHAKTGTTNNVLGLAGYVTSDAGEVVAFSFIYNGNDRWNARASIDAMGETIARWIR
ncbi:MAG TPA: D-alanyl-D-alanine carboxypeptidase/D-alanyl-D-alanine-endopeptidase [Gemmatimonadaceae bacterium]|nr:D-alanyl-D-alanine carboxypeptidase/D-alanyl-D-alanine-endopeptidase [Gemmatimonadaceae bacterium]